jgi:hypothetical protein
MNKAKAAEMKAKYDALYNELVQYVGKAKVDHWVWMNEQVLKSMCRKEGGEAWMREQILSLETHLNMPRYKTLLQISPETLESGGFLSHDISLVRGPSLREQFKAAE